MYREDEGTFGLLFMVSNVMQFEKPRKHFYFIFFLGWGLRVR
jgi:hypothetical protein